MQHTPMISLHHYTQDVHTYPMGRKIHHIYAGTFLDHPCTIQIRYEDTQIPVYNGQDQTPLITTQTAHIHAVFTREYPHPIYDEETRTYSIMHAPEQHTFIHSATMYQHHTPVELYPTTHRSTPDRSEAAHIQDIADTLNRLLHTLMDTRVDRIHHIIANGLALWIPKTYPHIPITHGLQGMAFTPCRDTGREKLVLQTVNGQAIVIGDCDPSINMLRANTPNNRYRDYQSIITHTPTTAAQRIHSLIRKIHKRHSKARNAKRHDHIIKAMGPHITLYP